MEKYIKSSPYNMIHLCINGVKDFQISGLAYNTTIQDPIQFSDIHDMILSFDKIFDMNGNPQSSHIKRSFQKEEKPSKFQIKPQTVCNYENYLDKKGSIATLDIIVRSRLQSTWQGIIFYQDEVIVFENLLDFIRKISFLLSI